MSGKNVLIVDDDLIIANLIEMRLKKLGYNVVGITGSGKEAISLAASSNPDVIIMDINIKGEIDGIETANRIIRESDIPVVYLTGDQDPKTFERAKATDDCEYLVKPFKDLDLSIGVELAIYKHALNAGARKQQEYYHKIFRSFTEGIITTDTSGFIVYMNPVASQLVGQNASVSQKSHIREVVKIVSRTTGRAIENPVDRVMKDKESAGIPEDAVLVTRDSGKIPVKGCVAPIREEDGTISGIMLVISPGPLKNYLNFAENHIF
jgi:PAS domain S-box-containing protein